LEKTGRLGPSNEIDGGPDGRNTLSLFEKVCPSFPRSGRPGGWTKAGNFGKGLEIGGAKSGSKKKKGRKRTHPPVVVPWGFTGCFRRSKEN